MPITNALQPHLTPAERKVVKDGWGDWTAFMQAYGLRPMDDDDAREGKEIVRQMALADARGAKET
ncbi:hypothetical protein JCM10450v2_002632 [Rhodotorula kratochvilovae]